MEVRKYNQQVDSYVYSQTLVESALKKAKNKYSDNKIEMFFFDNIYTNIYGPYLLNLRYILSEEEINIHDPKILRETCTYNGDLVAIVIFINK